MKPIRDSMKRNVISITARDTVRTAIERLVYNHIGTLPVVDETNVLVGTIRLSDIIELGMPDFLKFLDRIDFIHTFGAIEQHMPDLSVLSYPISQVMKEAVFVEEDSGLYRASAVLYKNNLSDLPIVDAGHHLVGIASRVDIGVSLLKNWIEQPGA